MCPLALTNKSVGTKHKCKARVDTDGLGSLDEDAGSLCQRIKAFAGSNPLCTTRLCRRCFDALPTDTTTTVRSPDVEMLFANDVDHESDCSERGDSDAETVAEAAFIDDSDHDDGHVKEALEDVCNSGIYTISSPQDPTLDLTEDNCVEGHGFSSTDAGDLPVEVLDASKDDRVGGHVVFTHVGNCISRHRGSISGTSSQKNWVQTLCSSISGNSCPLVQPEANLYPRHFFAASTIDGRSVLGARPLACMTHNTYACGMESALGHAR